MSSSADIPRHLATLRRRIRRVQWTRGILKLLLFFFAGLLLIAAIDFIFAPVPQVIRLVLFLCWLGSLGWAFYQALFRPLKQQIGDVKLARWLERRHPEVQERISTSLELSDHPEGVSTSLLDELSLEAATDLTSIDPSVEVSSKKIRRSLWSVVGLAAAIALLLAVYPQQMSRLLSRAISPFSDSGNAGAAQFTFEPGDIEVFEGDEVVINLTYEGEEEMRLFTKTASGEVFDEKIFPVSEEGETKDFQYRLHRADDSFEYFARSGKNESDHFKVTVYPKPKLENASVRYEFPVYTGWPDQVAGLTNGLKALAGTKMIIKSRVPLGVEDASFLIDDVTSGDPQLTSSTNGAELEWSYQPMEPGLHQAKMILVHRLKSDLEVGAFPIEIIEDKAPVVELIEPTQRELRLNPEDQVIFVYEVVERIGLVSAEVELEVDGKSQAPLKELLPKRGERDEVNLWSGEAMIYLGSLVDQYQGAREFRFRLKLSDNRPAEFSGPGIGYSDWVSVRLDKKASSLASQELRAQQEDIKKTIDEAIRETRQAQIKMEQAKHQLKKEKLPDHIQKKIAEARDEFAATKKKLEELAERMANTVQAHRSDEVIEVAEKLAEAQRNAEFTPLQDNEEARRSEAEAALKNSREAVNALQELRNEIDADRNKIDDLAKLQELVQKQDALAREAEAQQASDQSKSPEQDWQKQQERLNNDLREMVKQSPQAKAAALKAQAKRALELSETAEVLSQAQDDLKELSQQDQNKLEKIAEALREEQAQIAEQAKEELREATAQNETRAESLPEAIAKAEQASKASTPREAAESAKKSAEALEVGEGESTSQQNLQDRQEQVAEAFEFLAEGEPEKALAQLEEIQEQQKTAEIAEALQKEQYQIVEDAKAELAEARAKNEERANSLSEAVAQAEAASEASTPEAAAESAQKSSEALKEGEGMAASQEALQDRQEQVAEAFEALAEGDTDEALAQLEKMQAAQASDLAEEVREFTQAEYNQSIAEARNETQHAANRADQAMKEQANGKGEQAAQFHQESSQKLEQASQKLQQAAEQFSAQAEQAAQQEANQNRAPVPGEPLAEAFEESAEAAKANSGQEAAESAQAAAQALKQAAQQAKAAMAQNRQPGKGEPMAQNDSSKPGESGQEGEQAGDKPQEKLPKAQADPGVPPELARLGVSAADWEKIRATLKSDVGGSAGAVVPEDYRGLVKKYFEQVTGKK